MTDNRFVTWVFKK